MRKIAWIASAAFALISADVFAAECVLACNFAEVQRTSAGLHGAYILQSRTPTMISHDPSKPGYIFFFAMDCMKSIKESIGPKINSQYKDKDYAIVLTRPFTSYQSMCTFDDGAAHAAGDKSNVAIAPDDQTAVICNTEPVQLIAPSADVKGFKVKGGYKEVKELDINTYCAANAQ